jgi:hypothetical protein
MQKVWLVLLGLLWATSSEAAPCTGSGTTWTCPNTALASDVQAAHNSATSPYTITLAAGTYPTWTTRLTLTKAGVLTGSGPDADLTTQTNTNCLGTQTCLTGTTDPVILVAPTTDLSIRITKLHITRNSGSPQNTSAGQLAAIKVLNASSTFPLTLTRIDHNTMDGGSAALYPEGWIEGVFDHNRIENCYACLYVGEGDYGNSGAESWTRMYTTFGSGGIALAGSRHAAFFENNTFVHTLSVGGNLEAEPYTDKGGVIVMRYNTWYATGYSFFVPLGDHGDNGNFGRGVPIHEDYNNEFHLNSGCIGYDSVRGGSKLSHDNKLYGSGCGPSAVELTNDGGGSGDGIVNSFFWNNTINDVAQGSGFINNSYPVTLEREYYLHAPQASGGNCHYTGTPGPAANLSCTSSGTNAYLAYTPYTYPHPLQGTQVGTDLTPPAAPVNLVIR